MQSATIKESTMGSEPRASTAPQPIRDDGVWLEDLEEGTSFSSGPYAIEADEIVEFARRYDPQLFHLDAAAAAPTFFGGLAASGWLTAAVTMRLFAAAVPLATGVIGTEITLKWPSATRPGDVLHVDATVTDITPSTSRPDRATVTFDYRTLNQDGDVRQQTTGRVLVWRRPEPRD
jgi:acyl dehydratase